MISYKQYLSEGLNKKLFCFDMDETLLAHDHRHLKIHVRDNQGKLIRSLTNQEFNKYKLKPGEHFDFKDFRSSKILGQSAHPIKPMINRLNNLKRRGFKTEIVTARSDLDNKHQVRKHLLKHGINIDTTHLRRAGNIEGTSTGDRKRKVISDLIKKHGYKEVHLYDDDIANHKHFAKLKQDHPRVRLVSHVVRHNERTGRTNTVTIRH
jgi:hydroxymethylpyrimidine pyrophosphatase-like HAD family hydrolase